MICKKVKDPISLVFVHFGNDQLIGGLTYNPSKGFILNKPKNALWASPYTEGRPTKSAWESYCLKHNFHSKIEDFILFRLKSNAQILVIDKLEDLTSLDDKYINKELLNLNEFSCNTLNIDNISSDFHGIYVTENGLKECSYIFSEWEVESLALFTSDVIVRLYNEQ